MSQNKVLPPVTAFGFAMLAYLLFTAGDSLGKWLQSGYQASEILLVVNIVGLSIMLPAAILTRGRAQALKSTKWRWHLLRSSVMAISTMLVLYAVKRLPLSEFYGIIFLNPIWVALISRVFLKQDIPPSRWVAIFVGFMGVLVIVGAEFSTFNSGIAATLAASLMGAIAALLARHIGGHEAPTNFSIASHSCMIAFNLPLVLIYGFTMPALPDLGLMVVYGCVLSLAMMCLTLVFARSHVVSQVAPLQYTQMIWGVLFGWLVFSQTPTLNVVMGSLLVVGSGVYILRSLHRGRLMNH